MNDFFMSRKCPSFYLCNLWQFIFLNYKWIWIYRELRKLFSLFVSLSVPPLTALHHVGPRELHADSVGPGSGWCGAHRQQEAALPVRPRPLLPLSAPHYSRGCRIFYAGPPVFWQPGCYFDVCGGGNSVERLLYRVLSLWNEAGRGHRWVIMKCERNVKFILNQSLCCQKS